MLDFEAARRERKRTQKEIADELGVCRTTLLGWVGRAARNSLTPAQKAFFESPDGVQFLRLLLVAALFVMNLRGGLGVAMVRAFFTFTGLHTLVACSETSLRKTRKALIDAAGAWGDAQDAALARGMAPREIIGAFDENFHDAMMLVATDAESDFVLVEKVSERRDGKIWATVMREALARWPAVKLIGLIGDEAKGLIRCALVELNVLKGSDLFHVQHEICRGVSGAIGRMLRAAEKSRDKARAALEAVRKAHAAYLTQTHGPGRPPNWEAREKAAELALEVAEQHVVDASAHQEAMRSSVRELGLRYHPVDLRTGALLSAETVESRLLEGFDAIWICAAGAGLRDTNARVIEAIAKAQRVLPSLVGWVAAWLELVHKRLGALKLLEDEQQWVLSSLLPAAYLRRASRRAADAAAREALRGCPNGLSRDFASDPRRPAASRFPGVALPRGGQRSLQDSRLFAKSSGKPLGHPLRELVEQKVAALTAQGSPWCAWDAATRARVMSAVEGCVDLFVRTSSNVEGRNGQLSLHHHHTHRLTPDLLKALTVIHNYALTRPDGTTAAERFTGQKHDDLVAHLVALTPQPARSRMRKCRERPPMLTAA